MSEKLMVFLFGAWVVFTLVRSLRHPPHEPPGRRRTV